MPAIITKEIQELRRCDWPASATLHRQKCAAHRGHRRTWRAALRSPERFEIVCGGHRAADLYRPRLTGAHMP